MERKEEEEEKEEEGKLWTSSPGDDGRVGKTRTMTIVIGEWGRAAQEISMYPQRNRIHRCGREASWWFNGRVWEKRGEWETGKGERAPGSVGWAYGATYNCRSTMKIRTWAGMILHFRGGLQPCHLKCALSPSSLVSSENVMSDPTSGPQGQILSITRHGSMHIKVWVALF